MNQQQGIAKLKKLLGNRAHYELDERAPKEAQREEYRKQREILRVEAEQAKAKRDARYRELLSDPLYKQLHAEHAAVQKAFEEARWRSTWFRLIVGTHDGLGFYVRASGDNWADVIGKLEAKKEAHA